MDAVGIRLKLENCIFVRILTNMKVIRFLPKYEEYNDGIGIIIGLNNQAPIESQ
jgi:hypothetical protein